MIFFKVRMVGGYRIHVKEDGADAAICGAAPRERKDSLRRKMRHRAGWMVYRNPTASLLDKVDCLDCIRLAPERGAEYLVE